MAKSRTGGRPVIVILTILAAGGAAAIAAITAIHLAGVTSIQEFTRMETKQCLLSKDGSAKMCTFAYVSAGLSILGMLGLVLLECLTCNLCGLGTTLDMMFSGVITAWWVGMALMFSPEVAGANSKGLPGKSWRNLIVVLAWVEVGLFGALFLTSSLRVGSKCCGRKKNSYDEEKASLGANQTSRNGSSATVTQGPTPFMVDSNARSNLQDQIKKANQYYRDRAAGKA